MADWQLLCYFRGRQPIICARGARHTWRIANFGRQQIGASLQQIRLFLELRFGSVPCQQQGVVARISHTLQLILAAQAVNDTVASLPERYAVAAPHANEARTRLLRGRGRFGQVRLYHACDPFIVQCDAGVYAGIIASRTALAMANDAGQIVFAGIILAFAEQRSTGVACFGGIGDDWSIFGDLLSVSLQLRVRMRTDLGMHHGRPPFLRHKFHCRRYPRHLYTTQELAHPLPSNSQL